MDERDMTAKDPNGPGSVGQQVRGRYFGDQAGELRKQMEDRRERTMPAGGYAMHGDSPQTSPDPHYGNQGTTAVSTRWLIESKIDEHRGHIIRLRALLDLLPQNLGAISPLADDAIRMMVLQL